jgi:hypothetical protein
MGLFGITKDTKINEPMKSLKEELVTKKEDISSSSSKSKK